MGLWDAAINLAWLPSAWTLTWLGGVIVGTVNPGCKHLPNWSIGTLAIKQLVVGQGLCVPVLFIEANFRFLLSDQSFLQNSREKFYKWNGVTGFFYWELLINNIFSSNFVDTLFYFNNCTKKSVWVCYCNVFNPVSYLFLISCTGTMIYMYGLGLIRPRLSFPGISWRGIFGGLLESW